MIRKGGMSNGEEDKRGRIGRLDPELRQNKG